MIPATLTSYETKWAVTQKITSNISDVATTSASFRVLVTNVYLRQLYTSRFSTRLLRKHNLFSIQQIVTFWWRAVLSPRTVRKTQSQHVAVHNIKSLTKQWTQQFFHEQYKYIKHKKNTQQTLPLRERRLANVTINLSLIRRRNTAHQTKQKTWMEWLAV